MGPKRYTKMPCGIKDIPVIDAVVISHNHYDHLSYPTVKEISEKHPNCYFFAPLGNKAWFDSCGINNMTELDWWDERDIILSPSQGSASATEVETPDGASEAKNADIKACIGCLPCQHTSARGLFDRSKTLWSSWSIESGGRKVYFAGLVFPFFLCFTTLNLTTTQRHRLQSRPRTPRRRRRPRPRIQLPLLPSLQTNRPIPRPLRPRPDPHRRISTPIHHEPHARRPARLCTNLQRHKVSASAGYALGYVGAY